MKLLQLSNSSSVVPFDQSFEFLDEGYSIHCVLWWLLISFQ